MSICYLGLEDIYDFLRKEKAPRKGRFILSIVVISHYGETVY